LPCSTNAADSARARHSSSERVGGTRSHPPGSGGRAPVPGSTRTPPPRRPRAPRPNGGGSPDRRPEVPGPGRRRGRRGPARDGSGGPGAGPPRTPVRRPSRDGASPRAPGGRARPGRAPGAPGTPPSRERRASGSWARPEGRETGNGPGARRGRTGASRGSGGGDRPSPPAPAPGGGGGRERSRKVVSVGGGGTVGGESSLRSASGPAMRTFRSAGREALHVPSEDGSRAKPASSRRRLNHPGMAPAGVPMASGMGPLGEVGNLRGRKGGGGGVLRRALFSDHVSPGPNPCPRA
jgi:translation initiation factor IF-2